MEGEPLIPRHGGFRKLKSFQLAQLVYDVTIRFCERYVDRFSRTRDQMIQAARSGVQNIAEGSQASGTSKKTELKLTNVARASLEELRLDYEDFLRHRNLARWPADHPLRQALVDRRCRTADEVAQWVVRVRKHYGDGRGGQDGQAGRDGQDIDNGMLPDAIMSNQSMKSMRSTQSIESINAELSANTVLVLIGVACALLSRQIDNLACRFEKEGGFSERLYRVRNGHR